MTKYPEIEVSILGRDGNAFAIMGAVSNALRKAGISSDEVKEYTSESMSGDYENLLRTAMKWVSIS